MSLHWPEELRFLTYVVGQVWPDGDEDRMFAMAQAWLDAAESLEQQVLPVIQTAHGHAMNGYGSGAGRDQIASTLGQLQTGEHSIEQLVKDFRQIGTATRNAATTLEATKLMTIFATTMLAAQIAGAWLWPPTAPAVEAAAIGATRATLYRVSNRALAALGNIPHIGEYLVKTLRFLPRVTDQPGVIAGLVAKYPTALTAKATPGLFQTFLNAGFRATTARTLAELPADTVQFLISKAVNNLIWSGGLDATIQGIQISKGHRDKFDATQFGMSVVASTGGWYAGALVATNLSKYGGRFLTSRGKDPTAGVWGAGLGVLSGTVPTVVSSLVGGGIAMGFTGSFDPTVGLIGALASNSLIGGQRGYIGMRGEEPAATRTDHGAQQHNSPQTHPGSAAEGHSRATTLKSTEELISKIRGRDDAGYQAARARDRAAARDAERTPDAEPVARRAHRDAHTATQRAQVAELAAARRAVLEAQLDQVRAQDRAAAALDSPEARRGVEEAMRRYDEAVAADATTRARVQSRLEAEEQRQVTSAPAPQARPAPDTDKPLPPTPRAEKPLPPLPHADGDSPRNSAAGQRDSVDDAGPSTSAESRPSAARSDESEIRPATPPDSGPHRRPDLDSADTVPTREGPDPSAAPSATKQLEDPSVVAVRNKLATVDAHLGALRDADARVNRAYLRSAEQGMEQLIEQRSTHRNTVSDTTTARATTKTELERARAAHADAPEEQRPALRTEIDELSSTLKAQDRTIEDANARLAVVDRQLADLRSGIETASRHREQIARDTRTAMAELDEAGRAAAAAGNAHGIEPRSLETTHPFAHHEQLQREIELRRTEIEHSDRDQTALEQATGTTEYRLERQIAEFEAGLRTERTVIDGGYMSGKPKSRKLPLDHGMPDPFTALLPPTFDFWLPGGTDERPAPEPGEHEEPCASDGPDNA